MNYVLAFVVFSVFMVKRGCSQGLSLDEVEERAGLAEFR